jgi:cell division protein FtsL
MTPAKSVFCILLATALALAVVHQSAVLRQTGYRLEQVSREIAEEKTEYAVHEAHVCKLRSPKRILALAEQLGLDLEHPAPEDGGRPVGGDQAPETRDEVAPPDGWPQPTAGARVVDASDN